MVYNHYILSASQIEHIGTSYYYYIDGDDEDFDSQDFKLSDVPLSLGQGYFFEENNTAPISGLHLERYHHTKSVDAFGMMQTPLGDFECLRITIQTSRFTRPDTSSAFTLDRNFNTVSFVTEDGLMIQGEVSGISGPQTLSNIVIKMFLPTGFVQGLISEINVLQINNDGKGIAINGIGAGADASAVLEIESDSLGVLIPRIALANRPKTPVNGLLIYQTDNTPGFYYYDGAAWQRLDNTASVSSSSLMPKVRKQGLSQLTNGTAFIPLSNTSKLSPEEFMINLQAEGESNGLYISKKTAQGFEVKERNAGQSNIKFGWNLNEI